MTPFVIFSLPRSRSYWLSHFLTYGDWQCGHDEARHCRSLEDIRSWLGQPNTGTIETSAAAFWRLLLYYQPDVRVVTIRRPVEDVLRSLAAAGVVLSGAEHIKSLDHKLDQIERRVPGTRTFAYDDLRDEKVCAELFTHVLPYPHEHNWWQNLDELNLQINLSHMMRYFHAHRAQLDKLAKQAKHRMVSTMARHSSEIDGVVFQAETMASFDEAIPLFREHLVLTDQSPDAYLLKNIPLLHKLEDLGFMQIISARSNGRLFGYLMSIISPSLDAQDKLTAWHTIFFASPLIKNLGMKLQRAAAEALREKGVSDVQMRAGVRGAGPRLGAFYRRMGAEDFGHLYRLDLED